MTLFHCFFKFCVYIEILEIHLLPTENINLASFSFFQEIYNSFENLADVIGVLNNIAALPLTIEQRALFIHEVVKKGYELKTNHKNIFINFDRVLYISFFIKSFISMR